MSNRMGEIQIEKGVPLPEADSHTYPWRDMEIGDSFLVPSTITRKLSSAASAAGKRTGFRFTLRQIDSGVRVWRIA